MPTPAMRKTRTSVVNRLKILHRRRSNILGSAQLIKTFNDEYHEGMVHQIQVRIDLLDDLWKRFCEIQDEIEIYEESEDSEDLSEQRVSFQNIYVDLKSSLITKLPRDNLVSTSRVPTGQVQPQITQAIRLPEIRVPEFDGNPEKWIEFRDLFKSLVHANGQLTSVQKMHYLKAALKGEAHQIISSILVSTENYQIALKAIEERYDNPNLLIKRHISALFSIPTLKRESASGLSELLDQFDRHVSVLNQLEGPDRHWNSVLVESLSRRLDSVTLREWEKQCKDNERPTYEQLVNFVRKQARMLLSVKLSQNASVFSNDEKRPTKTGSTLVATEPSIRCPQCGYHMAKNCNSANCGVCGNRHHTLLHLPTADSLDRSQTNSRVSHSFIANEQSVESEEQLYPNQYNTQSYNTSPSGSKSTHMPVVHTLATLSSTTSTTVSSLSAHSEENKPESTLTQMYPSRNIGCEVFLATALIKVKDLFDRNHFVRIVLDSCSQCNFVSESLVMKLGLKRSKTNVDVIGVGTGKVHITETVMLNIKSRVSKFEAAVSCLVIPKIPAILPSKNINISKWNIPSNVVLADPRFNISAGVDVLVGAELFFSLLESSRISFAQGYPLLQSTVFGFVVSGMYSSAANQSPICIISTANSLETMLQRFCWEIENFDVGRALTLDEQRCEDHFRRTVSREPDGRYVVRLPLREDRLPYLGDAYQLAQRRFLSTERRFRTDSNLRDSYHQFMDEYARLGHMQRTTHTVTYGTTCAPFQATRVLMQLADDEESRFPLGAKIIRKNTYVDDTLAGGDNLNDVVNAAAQLRLLLAAGGFSLRKWCANDAKVLREIPPDLIEMPSEIEIDRSSSVKTLGLLWNPHIDQFAFKIPDLSSTDTISKRVVVSEMAQLFDPMGLVGSVVAAAKIFVQRLWIGQHTWDEPLPDELKDWWQDYREQLPLLHQLRVPRRVITKFSGSVVF
ncbi:uncharacterized protein LOC129767108 [Toxorhynchites rutilus septentrionalis]|uniref:uncharacterized protein LOC129767108 n=1 Tax=Toxorhynchites rutilus septentrionalis TaxID=329112 RepID=UPI0024791E94|nr:uncharacterized protein LOC129767108 [Toxorhynchites rutilus septentrionalis]